LNELQQNPSIYKLYDGTTAESMVHELLTYFRCNVKSLPQTVEGGELKFITLQNDHENPVYTVHSNAMIVDFIRICALIVTEYIRDDEHVRKRLEHALLHAIQCFYIDQYQIQSPTMFYHNYDGAREADDLGKFLGEKMLDQQTDFIDAVCAEIMNSAVDRIIANRDALEDEAVDLLSGSDINLGWRNTTHAFVPGNSRGSQAYWLNDTFIKDLPAEEMTFGIPDSLVTNGTVLDQQEMIETFVNQLNTTDAEDLVELEDVVEVEYHQEGGGI
jgi:hypothetical protein